MYCLADEEPAGWRAARLFDGERLECGATIDGPAIIAERNATIVVEPGWQASMSAARNLELRRVRARPATIALGTDADPVMLEVFNNLFMNIAEQMGLRLQNTAYSVNIKERLDFSCALFDAAGELIANAPHMPVHLGSMSESIRAVIAAQSADAGRGCLRAERSVPWRHPLAGCHGGHSGISATPVRPSFFVASRGHHADVGGITPGSMPPFSTCIAEEGVLIDNFKLLENGTLREEALLELLRAGPHPGAQSGTEPRRSAGAARRQRKGRGGAQADGGAVRDARSSRATCATCRTTPRNACVV